MVFFMGQTIQKMEKVFEYVTQESSSNKSFGKTLRK